MNHLKFALVIIVSIFLSGCNVSPLSPSNRPKINNQGEIGDLKNNQNGIMAEVMNLKNRLDVVAKDIENLQSGFINHNNKNSGVQIFQGDGGLIAGFSLVVILSLVTLNYKIKSDKYKKTAEILGSQIKNLKNTDLENEIFTAALAYKVEENVYKILKN